MTHLEIPATAGFPNAMPDIVDSLQRLERIGDEGSKTVEKIVKSAEDLEQRIANQYKGSGGAVVRPLEVLGASLGGEEVFLGGGG